MLTLNVIFFYVIVYGRNYNFQHKAKFKFSFHAQITLLEAQSSEILCHYLISMKVEKQITGGTHLAERSRDQILIKGEILDLRLSLVSMLNPGF